MSKTCPSKCCCHDNNRLHNLNSTTSLNCQINVRKSAMINSLKLKATQSWRGHQKPLDIFFGFKFLLHVTTLNPLSQEGGCCCNRPVWIFPHAVLLLFKDYQSFNKFTQPLSRYIPMLADVSMEKKIENLCCEKSCCSSPLSDFSLSKYPYIYEKHFQNVLP